MSKTLSILFLEDSPEDAEIAVRALEAAGYECRWDRVETRKDFLERLLSPDYDLVISDFKLPSFDGLAAIKLFVEYGFDIPFILVSGALGEEAAVESLRAGATDFVLKDKLFRLPQVVERALEEKERHRQVRQAEQKVRRQATALESAANAIIITDADGLITWVNPAFTKLTGYQVKEVVGKNPRILRSGEHDPAFYKNLWETLLSGKIWHGEMVNRRKDGTPYFEEQTIAPVMNDAGAIDGFIAIKQDISARRSAEREIRLPATVLRAGLVSFLLLILLEIVEMYLAEFVGEEIAIALPVVFGSITAAAITYFVLKKQKLMYLRTLEEVKEREQAEKAQVALNLELEAERLRLENIITSVPGVVWEAWGEPDAASQRIDFVSDHVESMLGHSVEEWLSTPNFWLTIVHPEDREQAAQDAAAGFAAGESNHIQEFRWIAKDGNVLWVEAHSAAIFDQDGVPVGLRGVTIDITDRKRAEVERRIISQIIQGAVDTPNLGEFLAFVHRSISKIVYAENCFVMLHDPVSNTNHFEFWVDKYDPHPPSQLADKGFGSYVLRTGRPLRITEESRKRIIDTGEAEQVGTYSPSWLGIPLRTPQRTIGVLVLQHYEDKNAYSDRDLELLSTVGDQIALAIERKQAVNAMAESEEKYRDLVENAIDIIYTHDLNGNYTSVNRAVEKITGYTRGEALLINMADVVAPEYLDMAKAMIAEKRAGKDVTAYELEIVAKNGARVAIEVNTRITYDNGVPIGVQGIARDVTERKEAQDKLRESERRFRNMLQNLELVSIMLDTSARLTYCNDYFLRLTGWSREEVLGADWFEIFLPADQVEEMRSVFLNLLSDKPAAWHYENEILTKDGERRLIRWNNTVLLSAAGDILGTASIGEDTTERKHLEDQFRQAQKMESVGILAGGVAHDFNNLLTAINGYSDLTLRRMDENDPFRRNIEEIKQAGERAAVLTEQLLAFSRKKVLQPTVHNLNPLIETLDKMLQRIIRENIELRTILDPELGNIKADQGQMEQVIVNLAVNARDAMPNGGTLTIETQNIYLDKDYVSHHISVSPGPFVRLIVTDTGHGMDEKTLQRIFDPFFTTKKMGQGTGLGLSMVFGIIKQSGGDIVVYSEVGRGTTFKIYLPRVDEDVQKPKWADDKSEESLGTETILLVEDEAVVRNLAGDVLRGLGYNVLKAASGTEALSICEAYKGPIHLVLSDVIMPRMSGPETIVKIRELHPAVKALFMSGYTDDAISEGGILDPGTAFLEKPFSPDNLARKVREVLGS